MRHYTEYKEPSVKLLRSFDAKREAWQISRPHLNHDEIDMASIEQMDLPINGFAHYVFHVNSSLLFRDLLFTMRPIVPWAKSNRTTPINNSNMYLSGEYRHDRFLQDQMNVVYAEIEKGIPQDFAKRKLPMAANTEFTVSIDERTLFAFLNVLRIHCPDLFAVYGSRFLWAIGKTERAITERAQRDIYSKLAINAEEMSAVGTSDLYLSSFVGVYRVSANLMSQFIRQHYSTLKSELYNIIATCKGFRELAPMLCSDEIVVALYADAQSFQKVFSVRSCWFGQWDKRGGESWSAILDPYVADMSTKEFVQQLPCQGCADKCTVRADMLPRVAGLEVNPPCAILLEQPDLIEQRKAKYKSNSYVFAAWIAAGADGLIADNPDNALRKEYEHNVALGKAE